MVIRPSTVWLLAFAAASAMTGPAAAGGFREQTAWQFRGAADTTVKLNKEATRLQANGLDTPTAGTAIGLGSTAGGTGSGSGTTGTGVLAGGSTVGNSTSVTNNYTVNVKGGGNTVDIEGYLNLDTNQTTQDQNAEVNTKVE